MTNTINDYIDLLHKYGINQTAEKITQNIEDFIQTAIRSSASDMNHYEYLKTIKNFAHKQNSELSLMNLATLQKLTIELDTALEFHGKQLSLSVFCGLFPTLDFNAESRKTDNGALLLVNQGTFSLIGIVLQIISFDEQFYKLIPPDLRKFYKPALERRKILNRMDLAVKMCEAIFSYLKTGNSVLLNYLYQENENTNAFLNEPYIHATLLFIVAHEYAHAYLGHIDKPRTILVPTSVGDLEVYAKNIVEEYEADDMAAFNLLSGYAQLNETRFQIYNKDVRKLSVDKITFGLVHDRMFSVSILAGPILFFLIDMLITTVADNFFGGRKQEQTHPPSISRLNNIMVAYKRTVDQLYYTYSEKEVAEKEAGNFGPTRWLINWFKEIEENIVNLKRKGFYFNIRKSEIRDLLFYNKNIY